MGCSDLIFGSPMLTFSLAFPAALKRLALWVLEVPGAPLTPLASEAAVVALRLPGEPGPCKRRKSANMPQFS